MPETRVDNQIFEKFPSFRRGIVIARNMNNRGSFTQLESLLNEALANAAVDPIDLTTDPRTAVWNETYRELGCNPKKFPPAHLALLKRVQKPGTSIPFINKAVAIMNDNSIRSVLPVGGDDVLRAGEILELRFADGGEQFTPLNDPKRTEARDALCLATDMGAYSIMLGGTNGGHLTSFSLVDVFSHGRACAMMNPYYTVFFAPAIEDPLRMVGEIYRKAEITDVDFDKLSGRELGEAVAEAMFGLARKIGFPTRLGDTPGFTNDHIKRALVAAKNPQLDMKLKNMPVPLDASMIDEYMAPILEGARDGRLDVIKNVQA